MFKVKNENRTSFQTTEMSKCFGWFCLKTFFYLHKNKLYKNNEAETGKSIRTNEEHFEV